MESEKVKFLTQNVDATDRREKTFLFQSKKNSELIDLHCLAQLCFSFFLCIPRAPQVSRRGGGQRERERRVDEYSSFFSSFFFVSRGCIDGVEEEPLNVKKERPQIQVERLDLPAFGCPTGLNSSCCQVFKMPSLSGEF